MASQQSNIVHGIDRAYYAYKQNLNEPLHLKPSSKWKKKHTSAFGITNTAGKNGLVWKREAKKALSKSSTMNQSGFL